jgi:3-oxoacyl-[acyl-carrier-protein] synthase II
MRKRIVITGLGIISPIGIGKDQFWNAAINATSGIGPLTSFDTSDFKIHIAAEVKGFMLGDYFDEKNIYRFGKQAQFGIAATKMALDDSGFVKKDVNPSRIGVVIGTLFGEPVLFEQIIVSATRNGLNSIDPMGLYRYPYSSISQCISKYYGFAGPSETIYCACSSGNSAISRACELIEEGMADIIIAGGVEILNVGIFSTFHGLRSLAQYACKPFDKNRDGIVFGEGAGILLIQSFESARRMNMPIYAEIYGVGESCDAYHASSPDPEGTGLCAAVDMALREANIDIADIDYISAHGTGTKMNDKVETYAIKKMFGTYSERLLISSIKSMIGHSMGASSAIESIVCCLAINEGVVPPTINYTDKDSECDLNYIPNIAQHQDISICMNNSLAFGGSNTSLIIGACR